MEKLIRFRSRDPVFLACLAVLLSWLFVTVMGVISLNHPVATVIILDPNNYLAIGNQVLDGGTPYVTVPVEHLPVSLIPIVGFSLLVQLFDVPIVVLWPVLMGLLFLATVVLWHLGGFDAEISRRFVLVSLPLLPLVLSRLEPWVVFLCVLSIALYHRRSFVLGGLGTVVAALAKGWPVILIAIPWKERRPWVAVGAATVSIGLLGVVALQPLFRQGRDFTGIHTETVVGSATLITRALLAEPLGVFTTAGAWYVSIGSWSVLLNLVPGAAIGILSLVVLRRSATQPAVLTSLGIGTIAIILVSPLLSPQFIFWITPFVAFASRKVRLIYILVGVLTLITVVFWMPKTVPWAALVLARNLLLIWLAVVWYRDPGARTGDSPRRFAHKTSLRNLPV